MGLAHTLGFPRIGAQRELKFALESFWRGDATQATLQETGRTLRARHWSVQAAAGMDMITVGDFAWYDHVLNTLALLGAIPSRFGFDPRQLTLPDYFTLARGDNEHFAMEMTKWFDTNYHYLVPEWTPDVTFDGGVDWLFDEVAEARAQGHRVKVALVGPLTLLYLGKIKSGLAHKLDLLPRVLAGYRNVLQRLRIAGVAWVQIDEPILGLELDAAWLDAFEPTYAALADVSPPLLLATYFDDVREHAALLRNLPVAGIHLDLVRGADQLDDFLAGWPQGRVLSAGIVDGRNIWRTDLDKALGKLAPLQAVLGDCLWIAPSCSLLHVPVDLAHEVQLDDELKSWLAFATQKLDEVALLKRVLNGDATSAQPQLAATRAALHGRKNSPRIHNGFVQKRLVGVSDADTRRGADFTARIAKQQAKWNLPLFPTTTIGSFPQTQEIRHARAAYKRGDIGHIDYLEARGVIPDARLWVNPDCGLNTRGWPETYEALANMVLAARVLRQELAEQTRAT